YCLLQTPVIPLGSSILAVNTIAKRLYLQMSWVDPGDAEWGESDFGVMPHAAYARDERLRGQIRHQDPLARAFTQAEAHHTQWIAARGGQDACAGERGDGLEYVVDRVP